MAKAAFVDIDNTLIKGYSQALFLMFLHKKGVVSTLHFLKSLLIFLLFKLCILKDSKKLREKCYIIFKGWEPKHLENVSNDFFNQVLIEKIAAHSKIFLDRFKNDNLKIYLLSATLEPIAKKVNEFFQLDGFKATKLELDANRLYTGRIDGDVIKGEVKIKSAIDLSKEKNIDLSKSYFISDDMSELELAKNFGIVGHLSPAGTICSYKR